MKNYPSRSSLDGPSQLTQKKEVHTDTGIIKGSRRYCYMVFEPPNLVVCK